jgi:hypothetical protein
LGTADGDDHENVPGIDVPLLDATPPVSTDPDRSCPKNSSAAFGGLVITGIARVTFSGAVVVVLKE